MREDERKAFAPLVTKLIEDGYELRRRIFELQRKYPKLEEQYKLLALVDLAVSIYMKITALSGKILDPMTVEDILSDCRRNEDYEDEENKES